MYWICSCALQYILLHLLGYKLSMDDLKQFRQLDSLTPGHPEHGHTDGQHAYVLRSNVPETYYRSTSQVLRLQLGLLVKDLQMLWVSQSPRPTCRPFTTRTGLM